MKKSSGHCNGHCSDNHILETFTCEHCDYTTSYKHNLKRHISKHNIGDLDENEGTNKVYMCEICDYITTRKSNLLKHRTTKKHKGQIKKMSNSFECICGNKYKYNSGLLKHQKKCDEYAEQDDFQLVEYKKNEIQSKIDGADFETVNKLLEELININKQILDKTTQNITITNTTNNQFNIMNYLNTDCKGAMNLSDFFKQVKYTYEDLLLLSEQTWVDNFKNTVCKQITELDKTERPIHCCDKKRKSFVCKENDEWERDTDNSIIIKSLMNFYTNQGKLLKKWSTSNKSKLDEDDYLHDKYMNTIKSLCGVGFSDGHKVRNQILLAFSLYGIKD